MNGKPFFDTNVLIYAFSQDDVRSESARALLAEGGVIGVQVLNEFVAVARRKLRMTWEEVVEGLAAVRSLCPTIQPLTFETHQFGLKIAQRFKYSIFDSLVIAAAVEAGCGTLYSEDMHDGQAIEGLSICNPFGPQTSRFQ